MKIFGSRTLLIVALLVAVLGVTALVVVVLKIPRVQEPVSSIETEPPVFVDHVAAAREAFESGDADAAEASLRVALEESPDDAESHALLARVHESQGLLDEALAEYRASLESDPDQAELRHRVGVILHYRGDLGGAIGELQEAVRLDGEFVGGRLLLADLYVEAGRDAEAVAELDAVLDLGPIGVDLDEIRARRDELR